MEPTSFQQDLGGTGTLGILPSWACFYLRLCGPSSSVWVAMRPCSFPLRGILFPSLCGCPFSPLSFGLEHQLLSEALGNHHSYISSPLPPQCLLQLKLYSHVLISLLIACFTLQVEGAT